MLKSRLLNYIENQGNCQQECEADDECIGIAYSENNRYDRDNEKDFNFWGYCYICYTDILEDFDSGSNYCDGC